MWKRRAVPEPDHVWHKKVQEVKVTVEARGSWREENGN
jgi:hypothetical protein